MKTEKSYVGLSKDRTKRVYAILKSENGYSKVIDVVTENVKNGYKRSN